MCKRTKPKRAHIATDICAHVCVIETKRHQQIMWMKRNIETNVHLCVCVNLITSAYSLYANHISEYVRKIANKILCQSSVRMLHVK